MKPTTSCILLPGKMKAMKALKASFRDNSTSSQYHMSTLYPLNKKPTMRNASSSSSPSDPSHSVLPMVNTPVCWRCSMVLSSLARSSSAVSASSFAARSSDICCTRIDPCASPRPLPNRVRLRRLPLLPPRGKDCSRPPGELEPAVAEGASTTCCEYCESQSWLSKRRSCWSPSDSSVSSPENSVFSLSTCAITSQNSSGESCPLRLRACCATTEARNSGETHRASRSSMSSTITALLTTPLPSSKHSAYSCVDFSRTTSSSVLCPRALLGRPRSRTRLSRSWRWRFL
mmetsp:Transcript_18772/g.44748  ORF Transcript_18772/g.44748 Transcript_18772/m.44748 type:complete len:288 (-) Transcript_18772:749-1612(-)